MFLNKTLDMPNFVGTEAPARLKTYRIQPEFGNPVFSFDMHMRWLSTIASVEEEPIYGPIRLIVGIVPTPSMAYSEVKVISLCSITHGEI